MEVLTAAKYNHTLNGGNFYSKGLYQWLKKNKEYNRIYLSPWNSCTGYDKENPVMMIGKMFDDGWFYGNSLKSVCRVGGTRQVFAFGFKSMHLDEWQDITDDFVAQYELKGRCHIHGDYDHDFTDESGDLKKCDRCCAEFVKVEKTVTKQVVSWIKKP